MNTGRMVEEALRRHTKKYAETHNLIVEVMAPIIDVKNIAEASEEEVARILATAQIIDAVMGHLVRDLAQSALVRLAQIKLTAEAMKEAPENGKAE